MGFRGHLTGLSVWRRKETKCLVKAAYLRDSSVIWLFILGFRKGSVLLRRPRLSQSAVIQCCWLSSIMLRRQGGCWQVPWVLQRDGCPVEIWVPTSSPPLFKGWGDFSSAWFNAQQFCLLRTLLSIEVFKMLGMLQIAIKWISFYISVSDKPISQAPLISHSWMARFIV